MARQAVENIHDFQWLIFLTYNLALSRNRPLSARYSRQIQIFMVSTDGRYALDAEKGAGESHQWLRATACL